MTEAAVQEPIRADLLAAQLGVEPAVVADVLAQSPELVAEDLSLVYVEHETRENQRYDSEYALTTLCVLGGEVDWSQEEPKDRAAAAVYGLRLLGRLGITQFGMGAAE